LVGVLLVALIFGQLVGLASRTASALALYQHDELRRRKTRSIEP